MKISDFIKNELESDNRYVCYNPTKAVSIFQHLMSDDDLEECSINVSVNTSLEEVIDKVTEYLCWLANCEKELRVFYENELGEPVDDGWFSSLEVYHAEITFNSTDDYGATISCGDDIIPDHILEFDFEKEAIVDVRLNG
jgi:hypothetical protein